MATRAERKCKNYGGLRIEAISRAVIVHDLATHVCALSLLCGLFGSRHAEEGQALDREIGFTVHMGKVWLRMDKMAHAISSLLGNGGNKRSRR